MSESNVTEKPADIRTTVRQYYGQAAASFQPKASSSCCGSNEPADLTASKLYPISELDTLPEDITGLSMGCGDPITLASLKTGQTVLDLGAGGGIDCFMAAKKVGETGHVIGVDMTAEMLEKVRANQAKLGFKNVEFRLGELEPLPVADTSWAGGVAGALAVKDYVAGLEEAGFNKIELVPVYFDQETVDEYVQVAEGGSCCGSGKQVVISDGTKSKIVELDEEADLGDKPFREAVFSAKIT